MLPLAKTPSLKAIRMAMTTSSVRWHRAKMAMALTTKTIAVGTPATTMMAQQWWTPPSPTPKWRPGTAGCLKPPSLHTSSATRSGSGGNGRRSAGGDGWPSARRASTGIASTTVTRPTSTARAPSTSTTGGCILTIRRMPGCTSPGQRRVMPAPPQPQRSTTTPARRCRRNMSTTQMPILPPEPRVTTTNEAWCGGSDCVSLYSPSRPFPL
ncbi:hypothetical protein DFH27DRAFT_311028 [Peziza echinospora]|nr:hypothetical protein DFH27DRAFT_311028 [Peziza echinospora]